MAENALDTERAYILKRSLDEYFEIEGDYPRLSSVSHHLSTLLALGLQKTI